MVSIVIPCFNSQATIRKVLESVVNQTYKDYEIIIVDDGSSDNTKSVIEIFFKDKNIKHKYIYQQNSGPSSARNKGVKNSIGEYVAFLDSDDEWHPQKLELTVKILEDERVDILGHGYTFINNFDKEYLSINIDKITFYRLLLKNFAVTPSIIIRRSKFQFFDETMRYTEDHELWLRMSVSNTVYYLDLPLVLLGRKPLTNGGLSANKWAMRKGEMKMYCKATKYKNILFFVLPFLILFSLVKHARSHVRNKFETN